MCIGATGAVHTTAANGEQVDRNAAARNPGVQAHNPDARRDGIMASLEGAIPQSVKDFFTGIMPKTIFGDSARRAEHYARPISNMPNNVNFLVEQMTSSQHFELLKGLALQDPSGPLATAVDAEKTLLGDTPQVAIDRAYSRLTSGMPADTKPAWEEVLDNTNHELHGKFNALIADEKDKLAFENVLAREVAGLNAEATPPAEAAAYAKLEKMLAEAQSDIGAIGAGKLILDDTREPNAANGERRPDVLQRALLDENVGTDLGEILADANHPLRPLFDSLVTEQKEIMVLQGHLPAHDAGQDESAAKVETMKILAEGASEQRNQTLDYVRREVISFVGRKLSEFMKKEGLPFDSVLERKTNTLVQAEGLDEGTTFDQLSDDQKVQVYQSIVNSASTANANLFDKFVNTVRARLFGGGH